MHGSSSVSVVAVLGTLFGLSGIAAADEPPGQGQSPPAQTAPQPPPGAQLQMNAQNPGGEPLLQQFNRQAESAGNRLNRMFVGDRQQNENEWAAAHPREAERKESGAPPEKVGRTNAQPREGRTNVQPEGRTSMQPGEVAPPPPQEGGFGRVVRDVTESVDQAGTYNPFAIEVNPLGLFVGGRLSFNAEWAPAVHHALVVSPYFVHTTADIAVSGNATTSQAFTGVGGELGYRYYTGHRGMNGIFVGPSLIAGVYNAGLPNGNQPFTNIGIAADVGVQDVFWNHLIVGGGIGVEYLSVSHDFGDLPTGPSTIASSGVKPRLLLSAGYGF